jgi:hypothetical protein
MLKKNVVMLLLCLAAGTQALLAQRLQVFHNVAASAAASVDVWVNGEKAIPNFEFLKATPFLDFSGTSTFIVEIKPPNSDASTQALLRKEFADVPANAVLHLIATGTPGSETTPLDVVAVPATREASTSSNVAVTVYHGSTDAPTVNVVANRTALLFRQLAYGRATGTAEVPAANYSITLTVGESMNVAEQTRVFTWALPAADLGGQGVLVAATGFINPQAANSSNIITLVAVLPSGDVVRLAPPTTTVQAIHNAADPALASVSVNIRPTALPDLDLLPTLIPVAFRAATPAFPILPAETPLTIEIFKGDTKLIDFDLPEFESDKKYVAFINGVTDPTKFAANPNGEETEVAIFSFDDFRERAANENNAEFLVFHGSTDAPAVDVAARGASTLVSNLKYGDFSQSYISVPPAKYTIDLKPAGEAQAVAAYEADLTNLRGGAGIVFASGFFDPSKNQDGPSFGLYLALPNGTVVELPTVPVSRKTGAQPLAQFNAYPNPAREALNLTWTQAQAGEASFELTDLTGRTLRSFNFGVVPAGSIQQRVDLTGLSQGAYLYSVRSGNLLSTGKVVIAQ